MRTGVAGWIAHRGPFCAHGRVWSYSEERCFGGGMGWRDAGLIVLAAPRQCATNLPRTHMGRALSWKGHAPC